ncbi:NAD(P)-dependent oxidoreductase [Pararcticibacter amylolyticus]|uniref:Histidine kinase n=1 Tax=Pararcticibacter amylolyticus TaxID=2173175 RepID=A0A2U2PLZ1_9SPHI|nr:NAD(P)H-binding protein [Pararcticibacter amylolyticus]PWG82425.1 histidine kinase [Pararcticibacter amylolyticus]
MKVALIGAGFVGTQLIRELTSRGHQVTVLVRNTEKIEAANGVEAVKSDVLHDQELAEKLKGHDAVINAFNAGWTNPNLYNDFMEGSQAIQKAVKESGVKRFITIGGAGSLYIGEQQLVDSPDFPEAYKAGATAARDYLNIIRKEEALDWTFFSPAIEMHQGTSGVRTGNYRTGTENPVFNKEGRSIMSAEDVAVVIADELENPKFIRQRFTAAY